jgi:hypothetical protein
VTCKTHEARQEAIDDQQGSNTNPAQEFGALNPRAEFPVQLELFPKLAASSIYLVSPVQGAGGNGIIKFKCENPGVQVRDALIFQAV